MYVTFDQCCYIKVFDPKPLNDSKYSREIIRIMYSKSLIMTKTNFFRLIQDTSGADGLFCDNNWLCTHKQPHDPHSRIYLVLSQPQSWPPRWPWPLICSGSEWCLSMDFAPCSRIPQEKCADISLSNGDGWVNSEMKCDTLTQRVRLTFKIKSCIYF